MEFVIATSTITSFGAGLFGTTVDTVFSMIEILWPYMLTVALIVGVVHWGKRVVRIR